jgi:hypothetical protein
MSRKERVGQYIQRLAFETLRSREEHEERPKDVLPGIPQPTPSYAAWSATSFAGYVPFRGSANG